LKDFLPVLETDEEIKKVGLEVKEWASKFGMPGL
jgi:hypothetical protein